MPASEAPVRHGWKGYQRSLSGIERTWVSSISNEYRTIRGDLLEVLSTYGLSSIAKSKVREIYTGMRSKVDMVSQTEVQKIVQVSQAYTQTQVKRLKDHKIGSISTVPAPDTVKIANISQTLADPEWIDYSLGIMLSEMSRISLSGDDQEAIERLLGVKLMDGKASPYRKGKNAMKSSTVLGVWGGGSAVLAHLYGLVDGREQTDYQRQACCAIDERTTNCCLNVHGQIVEMKGKFHLIGYPSFAMFMENPPFHWYCRTAIVLYHAKMDDYGISTQMMENYAKMELLARATTGQVVEIHPAHATSRR